ncbi:MAG: rhodanese-like domain-containing protein [Candidatus Sericytochromatia bacterium]
MRPFAAGLAVATLLLTTGCLGVRPATAVQAQPAPAAQAKAKPTRQAEIQQITVNQVAPTLKAKPNAQFIDVRMLDEYTAGHAPGALLRPLPELSRWAPALNKQAPVVVMCRSGSRSMKAAVQLQQLGFTEIINVQGGMLDWEQQGLPTERPAR